jgi:Zn-dependent protease
MLLAEPPPTQADLHFRLFGVPVRVHPFFWIVALLMGISGSEKADPVRTLIWVAIVFVSILVHELGHAFLQRRFGGHPWITLHGLGGLASCDDCDRSPRSQILISLAGPVAGFLFAALLLLFTRVTGHAIFPVDRLDQDSIQRWLAKSGGGVWFFEVGWKTFAFEGFGSLVADLAMIDLLFVNIWWGLVNLLPIYPLDGGRISRELFALGINPRRGIIQSLWLSIIVAGLVAIYGLSRRSIFLALIFGYLAYANYQTLRAYEQNWR